MTELPIHVCRVDTPDGPKDYVTCLNRDLVNNHGLPPQAIIGVLQRPLESGEAISTSGFARNRVFVEFMHSVISRRGPETPGLAAEAKRQHEGWVYVVDQRTPTPQDAVPVIFLKSTTQVRRPIWGHSRKCLIGSSASRKSESPASRPGGITRRWSTLAMTPSGVDNPVAAIHSSRSLAQRNR